MKGKTEFMLNVLIYADFSLWPKPDIVDFVD